MQFHNAQDVVGRTLQYPGPNSPQTDEITVTFQDGSKRSFKTIQFLVKDYLLDPASGRTQKYICDYQGDFFDFLGPTMEKWIAQEILDEIAGQPQDTTPKADVPMQCVYCLKFSLLDGICRDGESHCNSECFRAAG